VGSGPLPTGTVFKVKVGSSSSSSSGGGGGDGRKRGERGTDYSGYVIASDCIRQPSIDSVFGKVIVTSLPPFPPSSSSSSSSYSGVGCLQAD